jgi:DNA-binding XRE family transcriptional regulator
MEDFKAEVAYRRRLADSLGTPEERRQLRQRCGYSIADVAELTGLSKTAVRYRETPNWKHLRGSLDSDASIRYAEFIIACRGRVNPVGAS